MATGSIFYHINLPSTSYFLHHFYFALFTLHLYHKNTKNIILSYLSDLTFVSDREWIDNPFIALVASSLFVCVGSWDLLRSLLLDWYLGSQKLREILMLLCCITLSSSRKTNASSRRSNYWETVAASATKALAPTVEKNTDKASATGKAPGSGKGSCTLSRKRASSECYVSTRDVPESSTSKSKKSKAAPAETKKVSVKEDGTSGAFFISSTLDSK